MEVWHFEQKYDRLFQKYIDKFLQMKTEASSWPSGTVTDAQEKQYVEQYLWKEGIALEEDKIDENPSLRDPAKLCLNRLIEIFF